MDKSKTVHITPPDNALKRKIGYPGGIADLLSADKIAEGQTVIDDFKEGFFDAITALIPQFTLPADNIIDMDALFEAVKSLKGQSETLGFAFLAEISVSLHKFIAERNPFLTGKPHEFTELEFTVIRKHCDAILYAIKHEERGRGGMVEAEILSQLAILCGKVK